MTEQQKHHPEITEAEPTGPALERPLHDDDPDVGDADFEPIEEES